MASAGTKVGRKSECWKLKFYGVCFSHYDVALAGYDVNYFRGKGLGVRGVYVIVLASQTLFRGILVANEDG